MKNSNLNTVEGCFLDRCLDIKNLPIVDHLPERHQQKSIDEYKMKIVIEAINEGVPADWSINEEKYFLWPDVVKDASKPSGFRLSFDGVHSTCALANVPSCLTFRNRAGAKFFFDNFLPLMESVYL